jgi:hypothetical protein
MKTHRLLPAALLSAAIVAASPSPAAAHHASAYYYGPQVRVGVGFGFGYPWYGYPAYPYVYGPAYYAPGYVYPGYGYPVYVAPAYGHPAYVGGPAYPAVGFADLDVEPEESKVYVKGGLVGTADDYDGFPGYLPLQPGTRTVVLKHPGYKDLTLTLHVAPGAVVRVRQHMQPLHGAARQSH